MYIGKIVFSQVMDHLPMKIFHRCVKRYDGDHKIKSFTCLDQFLCMAFAQLTNRESLRETEVCLRAQTDKLYHMGYVAAFPATHCPTQTKCVTGKFMKTSRNR